MDAEQVCCVCDTLIIIQIIISCLVSVISLPPATHDQLTELQSELRTAETVDEWVAAAVAHGQPVGDQEDQVDELKVVDQRVEDADEEVDLVGEPAEAEDDHHYQQHDHCSPLLLQILLVLSYCAPTLMTF